MQPLWNIVSYSSQNWCQLLEQGGKGRRKKDAEALNNFTNLVQIRARFARRQNGSLILLE